MRRRSKDGPGRSPASSPATRKSPSRWSSKEESRCPPRSWTSSSRRSRKLGFRIADGRSGLNQAGEPFSSEGLSIIHSCRHYGSAAGLQASGKSGERNTHSLGGECRPVHEALQDPLDLRGGIARMEELKSR